MFDIIVPLGPYDIAKFQTFLPYNSKNVIGYRRIFVIACAEVLSKLPPAENIVHIDESIFPFNFKTIESFGIPVKRQGWYLQQLLKLYAGFVIHDLLPHWLVIDADSCFLKPVEFQKDRLSCYNTCREYHEPYFLHMGRLLPGLRRVEDAQSGIVHHMMFEKQYVSKLFDAVEKIHRRPFYEAFLACIDPKEYGHSGASEYEIYFNFMMANFRSAIVLRKLRWQNQKHACLTLDIDYISVHHYLS